VRRLEPAGSSGLPEAAPGDDLGGRLRRSGGRGLLLGPVAEACRAARSNDEHQEPRPAGDDRYEGDHGFVLVRLVIGIDCGQHDADGCYRSVFFGCRPEGEARAAETGPVGRTILTDYSGRVGDPTRPSCQENLCRDYGHPWRVLTFLSLILPEPLVQLL
jgi:hypothetical protein